MNEKITAKFMMDGKEKTISGQTVVVFGINDVIDFVKKETDQVGVSVGLFGHDIPDKIYADIMSGILTGLTMQMYKELDPMRKGFLLYEIGEYLKEDGLRLAKKEEAEIDTLERECDKEIDLSKIIKAIVDATFKD